MRRKMLIKRSQICTLAGDYGHEVRHRARPAAAGESPPSYANPSVASFRTLQQASELFGKQGQEGFIPLPTLGKDGNPAH